MRTSEFDYHLPAELIAQTPVEPRDSSRLLVLDRDSGAIIHRRFRDIATYLREGDLLVANDSRVLRARLVGRKDTGGRVEVLLVHRIEERVWRVLMRGHRLRPGLQFALYAPEESIAHLDYTTKRFVNSESASVPPLSQAVLRGEMLAESPDGERIVEFSEPVEPLLQELGIVPMPPYIHEPLSDPERYQTVYSRVRGSVAAPTAGLHFTEELIGTLQSRGVDFTFVTLHVGPDTFRPVRSEQIEDHTMHSEWGEMEHSAADAISETHRRGGRVVAIGTTAVRVLETAAAARTEQIGHRDQGPLTPWAGWTDLFIRPGYRYQVVDGLVTNFHLPKSTLLMLVAALAGKSSIDRAYAQAIAMRYRFFSFGDAMLVL